MPKLDRSGPSRLVLQARNGASDPVGVRAASRFLPHAMWRWPGETADQFYNRVRQAVVGSGVITTSLIYADELKPAPGAVALWRTDPGGSSHHPRNTGTKRALKRASGQPEDLVNGEMVKSLHGIPQGHYMKLKDLAAALGISGPMVSRLVKRGMPTELDAARRWRKRHLNPLQTKDARIGGPHGQRFGGAPAPRVEHAQVLPAVDAANAVRHAQGLADLAADLLALGRFESVEPLVRAALRAVPSDARAEVEMPTDVWTALTAEALRVCRKFDAEARTSSEPLDALTDDDADVLGPFWYAVAAGELVPSAGPAEG